MAAARQDIRLLGAKWLPFIASALPAAAMPLRLKMMWLVAPAKCCSRGCALFGQVALACSGQIDHGAAPETHYPWVCVKCAAEPLLRKQCAKRHDYTQAVQVLECHLQSQAVNEGAISGWAIDLVRLLLGDLCHDHCLVERPLIFPCSGLRALKPPLNSGFCSQLSCRDCRALVRVIKQ